jgi:hypothetical protein
VSTGDEIAKGDCHDCPWYEDCPRMRGINICYSDRDRASYPMPLEPANPATLSTRQSASLAPKDGAQVERDVQNDLNEQV